MSCIKTKTGENTITFDAFYQYIWARNYGDTDVYISNHNNIIAGDDDVALLPAGEAVRLTVNGKTLYVLGSTTLEVHAQNFSDSPFAWNEAGGGGGGGSITIDPTPTQGSSNAVSSGGVYTALQGVSPIDYSTTEQDTGRKWIDGKPIYQKTFSVNYTFNQSTPNQWIAITEVSVTNLENIIDYSMMGIDNSDSTQSPSVLKHPAFMRYLSSSSCMNLFFTQRYDFILKAVTVWYTKTTNTAE